jgi:hypothetical protein
MPAKAKVRIFGELVGALNGVEGWAKGIKKDPEGRDWVVVHPDDGPVVWVRYEHILWLGGPISAASCPKIEN